MVADVIKSFDTVDRSILDCAPGRLGLADWFRKVYFSFHSLVRLRFELAASLGEPWCRDGGIRQGCPLSMVFIVWPCMPRGAVILRLCLMSSRSFMLIILSVVRTVLVPSFMLLGSLLDMFGLLVRMCHLVSVFF